MRHIHFIAMAALLLTGCGDNENAFDATGTFEATEVVVSAEQTGRLLQFSVVEGSQVEVGEQVGLIDTVQLYLKAQQIGATRETYASQRPDLSKQVAALRQQLSNAELELRRAEGLVKDGAGTQKQLDDARNAVQVLRRQLDAQLSALSNQNASLNAQMSTADAQRYQVMDQLEKCHVRSPLTGCVLEKYAEAGEFATIGKPLFKVADMAHVFLRAYVTSAQLKDVRVGQQVEVFADYGGGERQAYSGTVSWISERSEFTPKTILTKEERADLVYAVKVAVQNDGGIKIGMYGELKF